MVTAADGEKRASEPIWIIYTEQKETNQEIRMLFVLLSKYTHWQTNGIVSKKDMHVYLMYYCKWKT